MKSFLLVKLNPVIQLIRKKAFVIKSTLSAFVRIDCSCCSYGEGGVESEMRFALRDVFVGKRELLSTPRAAYVVVELQQLHSLQLW